MSDQELQAADRAVARACIDQIVMGMAELRQILLWWSGLSDVRKQEFKDFGALMDACRRELSESRGDGSVT